MNIKVIIVWAFAIVIVGGIGLFGLVNQDLLVEQGDDIYTPVQDVTGKNYYCSKAYENGDSTYTFEVDPNTNQITTITMTYNGKNSNIDAYTSAEVIDSYDINGVQTTLSGTVSSFLFVVTVDLANYDKATVDALSMDFQKVAMIIDSLTDYESYVSAINDSTTGEHYTCNNN